MKLVQLIALACITAAFFTGSASASPYMGDPVDLVRAPNGAITNKKLLDRVGDFSWLKPTIENPAKGVWVFGGYGLAPMSIIEADDGLIAFDTGDTRHDGELMLKAIRSVTEKPVKVIIYGHSHTVFGAAVVAEGQKNITVIGHPNLNEVVKQNLGGGGAPSFYPEVGPYLTARALTQFNAYMPKPGADAYVVPTTLAKVDASAFLPVTRPVKDGEQITILGITSQFFTKYGSDDKVHTTAWLPERKIVLTSLLWSAPPQLYTLRGDVFRDPREWIAGLTLTRDLNAEVLVSAGARPLVGAKNIRDTLEQYLDGASFVLDQTLRGILHGLGPDTLRHFVTFPTYLADAPITLQSYGEISSYPPAIFHQTVGWYDNDAAHLKPLAPAEAIIARPATFVDYFRVRIDPAKSHQTNAFIRFEFSDGSRAGLHVRRAVAEFVADPDRYQRQADITVAMTGQTWARHYLGQATPEDLIQNGEIKVMGSARDAAHLINLFDRYQPERAVVIPPQFLEHAP